jgi:hypothetical protein
MNITDDDIATRYQAIIDAQRQYIVARLLAARRGVRHHISADDLAGREIDGHSLPVSALIYACVF